MAATFQPACAIGRADSIGSILPQLEADLIVADIDYQIERVFVGGKEIGNMG